MAEMAVVLRQLEAGQAALGTKLERHIANTEAVQPELAVHLAEWSAMKPQLLSVLDTVQRGRGALWLVPVMVAAAGIAAAVYEFFSSHLLIPRP